MHVLIFGVDDRSPTFIHRQVAFTRAAGVTISLWNGRIARSLPGKLAVVAMVSGGLPLGLTADEIAVLRAADVWHFQWPPDMFTYARLARTFGKPTILSLRGKGIDIEPYQPGFERYAAMLRQHIAHQHACHAVSAAMLEAGVKLGAARERSRVIYTAVDLTFFSPPDAPPPDDPPLTVLMVGALLARKGYDVALETLAALRDRHGLTPHLHIIGEGEARGAIEAQRAALGLGDQVMLMGRQGPEAIRDAMRGAHVLLHTATNEGIANVAAEALACGLPVVTSDVGGMREAVGDGIEGFVVPPHDPTAAADALARLLRDASLRAGMRTTARARAERQFAADRLGREFAALYAFAAEAARSQPVPR